MIDLSVIPVSSDDFRWRLFPSPIGDVGDSNVGRLHQVARGPELRVFKLGNVHLASVYYIHIYTYIYTYMYIYICNIYIYIYIIIHIHHHIIYNPYFHISICHSLSIWQPWRTLVGFGPWLCCPHPRRVCHWRCGSRRPGWNSLLRGFQMMAPKWWLKATRQKKMRAHVISWGREIKDDKCETTKIEESSISTRLGCFQNFLQKHLNGLTQALCLRIGWRMMKVRLSGNPYIKNGKNPMETISK